MSKKNTLNVHRGDDVTISLTFKDETGAVVDLTGSTILFTVKDGDFSSDASDSTALISKSITSHNDPTNGISAVGIDRVDTLNAEAKDYSFELVIKNSAGKFTRTNVGIFRLLPEVTKRES